MDFTQIVFSLSPWLFVVAFACVPFAYWRDSGTEVTSEAKRSRKRTLLLTCCSYGVVIIGSVALATLGENGLPLFFMSCLLAPILAIAAIISGAMASGWTRIAAVIAGAVMLFILVFSMTHCDL